MHLLFLLLDASEEQFLEPIFPATKIQKRTYRTCLQKYESITFLLRTYARMMMRRFHAEKKAQSNQQTAIVLGQLDVIGHSDKFVSRFLIGG